MYQFRQPLKYEIFPMSSTESVIKSDRFNHPEVAKSWFPTFKNLLQIRTPLKRDMTFTPPHKKIHLCLLVGFFIYLI